MSSPARQKRLSQAERIAISDNNMLQAASELILEVGSANTTLKDVGERAGYSRGLASARFGSKEELFLRLISSHRQIWSDEIDRHIGNKTGFAAIMARIDAVEELIKKEPDTVRAIYTLWFESAGRTTATKEQLMKFHDETRRSVALCVEQGIEAGEFPPHADPERFAINYFSQIFGFIYQWLISPEAVDLQDCIGSLRALCVFALTNSDPDCLNPPASSIKPG
jgi:AcrR family transcriptional regulator